MSFRGSAVILEIKKFDWHLLFSMDNLLKFSEFSTGDIQFTNHVKNFVFSLK